ncbi:hypothetical protein ACPXB5_11240 [Micromonospora arida]|uniref:hypothetical protein n=1 Tax=Micromonospora arida TaxID=2203715 RepID=UPI003CF1687A
MASTNTHRWFVGRFRLLGGWRWLPLYASPTFDDPQHPFRTANGVALGTFGHAVYAFVGPVLCVDLAECFEPAHHEYRLWPIPFPTPHAFRRGLWPVGGTRADRAWMWLRGLRVIRLRHK